MNIAPLGREATLEDLWEFDDPAELIDGRIVQMTPKDARPGKTANRIQRSLEEYQYERGGGEPISQSIGFILETAGSQYFIPDVFWWTGPVPDVGLLKGAPSFAAEIRSRSDYGPTAERAMAIKRAHYFAGGTQVVWDVDVLREGVVRVYRSDDPEHPTIYHRGEIADAEPAVPGWRMPVDELFA
jgi:Uma2 family endonuclease